METIARRGCEGLETIARRGCAGNKTKTGWRGAKDSAASEVDRKRDVYGKRVDLGRLADDNREERWCRRDTTPTPQKHVD